VDELGDRLRRAEDLARAIDVLGSHLVAHAGDHDAIDGLCGVTSELKRLLVAARDLGDTVQRALRRDSRAAA
jgi:hypothetical protein